MGHSIRQAMLRVVAICFMVIGAIPSWLFAQSPWPGQSGNSVGYAAWGTLGTTPWPGGGFTSGTASNPTIYTGYVISGTPTISGSYVIFISCDFTGGAVITGDHLAFIGSRFQSNNNVDYNVKTPGGTNLTFMYDSFVPLVSFGTSPPGATWPSAGAGSNTSGNYTPGVNCIDDTKAYQYGINAIPPTGPITVDHSDFWGFGNAIAFYDTTTQMILTNNWIHDSACYQTGTGHQGYHNDGPGYLNNGTGPSNVLIQGNAVASLGNTNGFAFQQATAGYSNMQIYFNYWGGFGNTMSPGDIAPQNFTNSALYGNTFGTDMTPDTAIFHGTTLGTNTVWACNVISFLSGTTWSRGGYTPVASDNGKFWVLSNSAPASSADQGGNTVCSSLAPSSVNFKSQGVNTTSSDQTITFKNVGSSALTISSIGLQTGTQFAISSSTCGSSLGVNASCSVAVKFTPTSLGVKSDNLRFNDNSPAPSSPQLVPLIGLGTAASTTSNPNPPTGLIAAVK